MKTIKQKLVFYFHHFLWLFPTTLFFIPSIVIGQVGEDGTTPAKLDNPIGITSIEGFLRAVLNILQTLGFIVAVVFIVYAGFLYVTAAGDETKISKAHKAFLWSVVGLAVLLGAMVFAQAIQGTVESIK